MKNVKLIIFMSLLVLFSGCDEFIIMDKPLTNKSYYDSLVCNKKFLSLTDFKTGKIVETEDVNISKEITYHVDCKNNIISNNRDKTVWEFSLSQLSNGEKYISFASNEIYNINKDSFIPMKYVVHKNTILLYLPLSTEILDYTDIKSMNNKKVSKQQLIDSYEKIQEFIVQNDKKIYSIPILSVISLEKANLCLKKKSKKFLAKKYNNLCLEILELKKKLKKFDEVGEKIKERTKHFEEKRKEYEKSLKLLEISKVRDERLDWLIEDVESGLTTKELKDEVLMLPVTYVDAFIDYSITQTSWKLEKIIPNSNYALYKLEFFKRDYYVLIEKDENELYTKGNTFPEGLYQFQTIKEVDINSFLGFSLESKKLLVYKRIL